MEADWSPLEQTQCLVEMGTEKMAGLLDVADSLTNQQAGHQIVEFGRV